MSQSARSFALLDFTLGLKPKFQVMACRASVLFPNFPGPHADLLLGASRLQTLPQPLPNGLG
jgi:hypothetical protein